MESLVSVATVQRSVALAEFDVRAAKREIEGLAVPYNRPTRVSDDGGRSWYSEAFAPGVFDRHTLNSPANIGRVRLNWTHDEQFELLSWIGRALELRESAEGLVGVYRVDDSPFGDAALAKVADRQVGGMSISAKIFAESRARADGVVWRTRAALRHVALVEQPAYVEAAVTAVRERPAEQSRKVDVWRSRLEQLRA